MFQRIVAVAIAIGATFSVFAPTAAHAQQIAALSVNMDKLFIIDESRKGGKVEKTIKIKTKPSDRIMAIDVRAADRKLYGVSQKGNVYKINFKNGKVEKLFSLGVKLEGYVSMDCNPVADACRLVNEKGMNMRFTFETGVLVEDVALTYAGKPGTPSVIAIAYTNAFAGATTTELFDIDAATDKLYEQDPPNSGVLNEILKIRPKVEKPLAFDVFSFGEGDNFGGVIYQKELYTFSFSDGVINGPIKLKGLDVNVRDMAFIPTIR